MTLHPKCDQHNTLTGDASQQRKQPGYWRSNWRSEMKSGTELDGVGATVARTDLCPTTGTTMQQRKLQLELLLEEQSAA
eukprot:3617929-Rhodomonas_salina.1